MSSDESTPRRAGHGVQSRPACSMSCRGYSHQAEKVPNDVNDPTADSSRVQIPAAAGDGSRVVSWGSVALGPPGRLVTSWPTRQLLTSAMTRVKER